MPRVSDWPPAKPLGDMSPAEGDMSLLQIEQERQRRFRDLTLAGVWLVGACAVIAIVGFLLF